MSKANRSLNIFLLIIILAGTYLSQVQNLVLLLLILFVLLVKNKYKISFNMPGEKLYLAMLIWGILIGFINIISNQATLYEIFKQTYYYLMLFLYWHIGEQLARGNFVQRESFLKTVLVGSTIISLADIAACLGNIAKASGLDINSFRNLIGAGNIISIIGVYLCLIYKRELGLSKSRIRVTLGICIISSIIHFSRMMLLYALIFALTSGIRLISKRWLKYIAIGSLSVVILWSIFPELTQLFINKLLSSFTEINFKTNVWNSTTITQNWRGYEVACAIDQFKHSSILSQLFGHGFGTTLDVKGYAYLVTDEERLSFLHNGYFTQLLIWGILGIICFFLWIVAILKKTKNMKVLVDKHFTSGLIIIVLAANYFIMGPFFSATVASLFLYISILFGLNRDNIGGRNTVFEYGM